MHADRSRLLLVVVVLELAEEVGIERRTRWVDRLKRMAVGGMGRRGSDGVVGEEGRWMSRRWGILV